MPDFNLKDTLNLFSKFTLRRGINAGKVLGSYFMSKWTGKPVQWGYPISISFEPTTSCNLRCPECPSGLRAFTRPTGMLEQDFFRTEYVRNDLRRCFHCKDELFQVMEGFAAKGGFQSIAYGVNVDDQGDFRPGQQAARSHHVAAPLLEAGLTKAEIRELARTAGLRVWDKPASACLSSRIEYGRPVTREALTAVEQGEDALRALGFRQFRVRHHGEIARIEIAKEEMDRALTPAMFQEFTRVFKGLGFTYVTLDTEGFRSGSMNSSASVKPLIKLLS